MKVKAVIGFAGAVSMAAGEVRDVREDVAAPLLKCGYLEAVEETPAPANEGNTPPANENPDKENPENPDKEPPEDPDKETSEAPAGEKPKKGKSKKSKTED